MMQHMRHMLSRPLIVSLLVLLAACSMASVDNDAPVQVVREFVAAWEENDTSKILRLIEPSDWRMEMGPEIRSYTGMVDHLEFADPTYTLVDNTGDLAHVRLTSTVQYTLRDGNTGNLDIDVLLEVVRIDDAWYLRSLDMSELPGP